MWKELFVNLVVFSCLFTMSLYFNGGIDRCLKALKKKVIPYRKVYSIFPYWKFDLDIGNTQKHKVINEHYKSNIALISAILGFFLYFMFISFVGFSIASMFTDSNLVSELLIISKFAIIITIVCLFIATSILLLVIDKKKLL